MPTENRSSNTEQMVSVPRELLQIIEKSWRVPNGCPPSVSAEVEEIICNGLRRLRALLAQPAAQHQGEPAGWTYEDGKEYTACPDHAHDLRAEGIELSPVYRHPPTPDGFSAGDMADQGAKAFRDGQRALVLPDRMGESTKGNGWNACLDEVRRLNEACITPE